MIKYLALMVLALLICGCASWQEQSGMCFPDKAPPVTRSAGDVKSLDYVKRHVGSSCRQPGVECHLVLQHAASGEIQVTASRAVVLSDNPPTCQHLDGGFETYIFSPQGKYIRVVLGL